MRNIFDQYSQPENRVTHALASALGEDTRLLRQFIRWVLGAAPQRKRTLEIVEQRLPGDAECTEVEAEQRGLPDMWIHDGDTWSLIVESKISARLQFSQLQRHYRTAVRRGFKDTRLLVIDVKKPRFELPEWAVFRSWSEVYQWLWSEQTKSSWAGHALRYFEVAESRFAEEGYLKNGTLTVFSGIPFGDEDPYSYLEAKRIIRLAMDDLRGRRRLVKELGMNPSGAGRGAITGREASSVWDFIPLKGLREGDEFIRYPHLTVSIERDQVRAAVTIPNGVSSKLRKNLLAEGYDEFADLMEAVTRRTTNALRRVKGSSPSVNIVQRRYPAQRSVPIVDSQLQFDLRTAFPSGRGSRPVKQQRQWLEATYEALAHKRSNLQVAVGAVFPYRLCPSTKKPRILDAVEESWLACKPLLQRLRTSR